MSAKYIGTCIPPTAIDNLMTVSYLNCSCWVPEKKLKWLLLM